MKHITCIEDLRQLHKRRVPKAFFDYADRGSYTEDTLRANRADLEAIKFRQRILVDISKRDTSTTILGETLAAADPGAGRTIGHAAQRRRNRRLPRGAGRRHPVHAQHDVDLLDRGRRRRVDKPFWFQLYVMKDRGFIKALLERAIAAKCSALVLTVDLQVLGQRHQDIKNGMTVPPEWSLSQLFDFASKPSWIAAYCTASAAPSATSSVTQGCREHHPLSQWTASQFDTTLSWKDVEWIRSIWPGKLVLKGISTSRMPRRR